MQEQYSHGNAESDDVHYTKAAQTKRSTREEMKISHDRPNVEYISIYENEVTAPRNIKQEA